jgi:carbonic anhydrase/acetyltransferase-like protein (isoleucine patch superfamily)
MPDEASILPGAYVADGVVLRTGVVIWPNAVVLAATDPDGPPTTVHSEAVIGANATILPGVQIGQKARISPGSVVTRSVPPLAVVEGNPARIVGYVDSAPMGAVRSQVRPASRTVPESLVRGVTIRDFTTVIDIRGSLSAAELGNDIPFQPARFFLVYDVPSTETRGAHAHRRCQQLLVAAKGHLAVVVDDGEVRQEFLLDSPSLGLHLPAMTWGIQYKCSADAVLLVLASDPYDPADYIRDYAEFVALAREARRG